MSPWRETGIPDQVCPRCGHPFDRVTAVNNDDVPEPGDLSACIECEAFLIFGPDLIQRLLTPTELAELPESAMRTLLEIREAIRRVNLERPR